MTPYRITRSLAQALALGLMILAASGCQRTPPAPSTSPSAGAQTAASPGAPTTAANEPAAATAAPATPTKAQVCSLLSAAEVGAIMGKTLVKGQDGCSYGLDSSAKEKELAQTQQETSNAARRAASAGDMNALMRGMTQVGAKHPKLGSSMMEQMTVSLDATRDDQTEEALKSIYANTGNVVRGAVSPEKHGLTGVIQGIDEIGGVGDWAFATNVASVNMGGMLSIRGRILEARKGPWRLTVSVTVAPDPGVPMLDGQLANVARALFAKL